MSLSKVSPKLDELSEVERDALARKTLRVLIFGQAMGSAGFGSSVAVGGLIIKDLLGGDRFAGAGHDVQSQVGPRRHLP